MHEGLQLLHGPFIAHHAGTKCLAVNGCDQGQEKGQSTSIQPLGQIMLMPAPGSVHTGEGRGGSIHAPHAGADALMQEGASAGSSLAYQGGGKRVSDVPQCRIAGHCHTSPPSTRGGLGRCLQQTPPSPHPGLPPLPYLTSVYQGGREGARHRPHCRPALCVQAMHHLGR